MLVILGILLLFRKLLVSIERFMKLWVIVVLKGFWVVFLGFM